VIQRLDTAQCDYFRIFGVHPRFGLDDAELEGQLKTLQKQLHPDKFTTRSVEERDRSQFNSSVVNQAYQVLRSPVDRAAYLLQRHSVDILSEGTTYEDAELMAEVFELRERVDDLAGDGAGAVDGMRQEVTDSIREQCRQLSRCLDGGTVDLPNATKAAVRLKYLSKVVEELEGKQ